MDINTAVLASAAQNAYPPSKHSLPTDKADAAAKDFESMFLSEMIAPMMADMGAGDELTDGESSDIYRSLLGQEYGKMMTGSGGIGIAGYVKQELLKLQEIPHAS